MRRGLRILAGFVCVALVPVAAFAQASITGTVKDASGAVLPGVTVEAASPALIEKVRTAVSDGSGQYRIENLRPGAYSVTFTLPGFSTVKREGIELTGTFVATVNADLKVGTLEETITVTGETPTVDVQSVVRQRVLTTETMEELPVNRMAAFIASLIPGVNNSSVDVGGSLGPIVTGGGMTVHGSRSTDLLTMSNGLSLQSIQTGSAVQGVANMAQYQEVAIDTAAADASQSLGGVRTEYGNYAVIDVRGRIFLDMDRHHRIDVNVKNLFDRDYATHLTRGFPDDGGPAYAAPFLGVPRTLYVRYTYAFF